MLNPIGERVCLCRVTGSTPECVYINYVVLRLIRVKQNHQWECMIPNGHTLYSTFRDNVRNKSEVLFIERKLEILQKLS